MYGGRRRFDLLDATTLFFGDCRFCRVRDDGDGDADRRCDDGGSGAGAVRRGAVVVGAADQACRPVRDAEGAAGPDGVPGDPGGVHQGRAEEPEAGAAARRGGGQAHPVRAPGHRPVPRDGRRVQRHRPQHHRADVLRADPQHDRPRGAEAQLVRRPASPLELAGRHPPAGGRLDHQHAGHHRETRRDVRGHRRPGHPEAGDPRGGRAAADPVRPVQDDRDRPAARRPDVGAARHGQDDDGEGGRAPHDGVVHPGGRVRVRPEVPGRGAPHGTRRVPPGPGERPVHHLHRRGRRDRHEAVRRADRRRPRGAAHPDGAADADGRVRPVDERQGDHGDEPGRHARPGAAAPRPSGPQDRVPAAGPPPEAPHLPGGDRQDEPVRGDRPGGLRAAPGEGVRRRHRVDRPGGRPARRPQQPVRHPARRLREGVQEQHQEGGHRL
ncbi:hypothetical protein PBRA_008357 [Plasmodiophora brassicae]|uniref:Uncharacterized protein n=1 Tax=Plasmodiophora brassicae TaxID=37360 RepID=A0A0G4J0D5_PLABS|nr:hypothetical protein PBRA_008357 [Plasmodiophora brassicae]